jgi:hypothetical protein
MLKQKPTPYNFGNFDEIPAPKRNGPDFSVGYSEGYTYLMVGQDGFTTTTLAMNPSCVQKLINLLQSTLESDNPEWTAP